VRERSEVRGQIAEVKPLVGQIAEGFDLYLCNLTSDLNLTADLNLTEAL
jgi:hypothetical protein